VSNFPELERVIREWVYEAVDVLSQRQPPQVSVETLGWQLDHDGVFRNRARQAHTWNDVGPADLRQLRTWGVVEAVFNEDPVLRAHVGQLVGTARSASTFDPWMAAMSLIPRPDQARNFEDEFAAHYSQLDRFLGSSKLEHMVVWPISGLTANSFPVNLEPGIKLDRMSDSEMENALNVGLIKPRFPRLSVLTRDKVVHTCLHHTYHLPKLIEPWEHEPQDQTAVLTRVEGIINEVSSTFQQLLALLFFDVPHLLGRLDLAHECPTIGHGVGYNVSSLSTQQLSCTLHLDDDAVTRVQEWWQVLRRPGTRHKALALAIRRMHYRTQRDRVDDELIDVMIAAEALYLSDVGSNELGFRLALRASAWCKPSHLDMSRREVFDLMKSAYKIRCAIVHGDEPKQADIVAKGDRVPLSRFVEITEKVVRQGLQTAISEATQGHAWPPDWDGIILRPMQNSP